MDLDRFFSVGADAPYAAQDVFTNRISELAAFDAALAAVRTAGPATVRVEDVRGARRNVLGYYGLGGVGKSRLSKELDARFLATDDSPRLSHRVDFTDSDANDLEGLLLGLRACLGQHRPVWPAFDLALAVYWERAHPGVPLADALNDSSRLRRIAGKLRLGDQLQDAVEDLLDSPGGVLGVFAAGARALGTSAVERVRENQLLRECPLFGPVVSETDPQKMRPYLSALLAWDLAQLQDRSDVPVELVVFFDTWELVQDEEPRRGGPEDLLSRVVHLMPNVLFVVTGRDRLRWADPDLAGRFLYSGPADWPGLDPAAEEEPRQHLVGGLSPADADRYLRTRLLDGDAPAIPDEIRAAMIDGSEGLPLYLDLAATRFEQVSADGVHFTAEDFGQPLAEVVLRVMRDLPSDQRALLRLASLVHAFDLELLRSGLPELPDASSEQFVRRAVVSRDSARWLPFALHECLRDAVHPSDVSKDRWSDREWHVAASRMLDDLARRADPELAVTGSLLQSDAVGVFLDAWRLSVAIEGVPDWVLVLGAKLQSRGAREALVWPEPDTPSGSPLRPVAEALSAIGRRAHLGHEQTAALLESSLARVPSSSAAADLMKIWLAWQYEGVERRAEADELRLDIATGDGPFAANARHALGRADWVHGRLGRARSWEFDDRDPVQRGWRLGVHSRVAWILGRLDESEELSRRAVLAAEEMRSPEALAGALRSLGESRCFSDPGGDDTDSRQAIEIHDRLGARASAGEAAVSVAIHRIGIDPVPGLLERIEVARRLMRGGGYADCAEVFLWCVEDDEVQARAARERVAARRVGTAYAFWDAITAWWIDSIWGGPAATSEVPVQWPDGQDEPRRRWIEVLGRRRSLRMS